MRQCFVLSYPAEIRLGIKNLQAECSITTVSPRMKETDVKVAVAYQFQYDFPFYDYVLL